MKQTNCISDKSGERGELAFFICEDGGKDILPHLRIGVRTSNKKYRKCVNEIQFSYYPEYKSVAVLNFRADSNYTVDNLEFVGEVSPRVLTPENKQLIVDWLLANDGGITKFPNYLEALCDYLTSNDIVKDIDKYNNFIKIEQENVRRRGYKTKC
ncbi:MAG: hypothetical protein IJ184_02930 [Alphaproteobacteria bacterium]|nr:hypothetical protein [Alphaproteobacteria bacterium]